MRAEQYKINDIDTLCDYIMAENPTREQINSLLDHMGLKIFLMFTADKETYCSKIKAFLEKYKVKEDMPIFVS